MGFISDEVSPSLEEAIQFAKKNQVTQIELRTVQGINLMNLSLEAVQEIATQIHTSGLTVSALASPLLKWLPPHKISEVSEVNQHGYEHQEQDRARLFEKAFILAEILKTKYIRIFSYIKYKNFADYDLDEDLTKLIELAEKYDRVLLLENEPICNICTLPSVYHLLSRWHHPRLRTLLDIGNLYQMGEPVRESEIMQLAPYIEYAHLKDFSVTELAYVPVGKGSVNYRKYLTALKQGLQDRRINFSLETHVKNNGKEATQLSLDYCHEILQELLILTPIS